MAAQWLLSLLLAGISEIPAATSDPHPSPAGSPEVSFLLPGCRLETTAGADWHRLWLNCGKGPHLLSEPSSLTWHVRIRTPEQALELVRLFTAPPRACQMIPGPRLVEVGASDRDRWLAIDQTTYDRVCPKVSAREVDSVTTKRFVVNRCVLGEDDGNLYSVEERVRENGETEIVTKTLVMSNLRSRIGSCDPAAPPR